METQRRTNRLPRVLIVEDDADHRMLMREALETYYAGLAGQESASSLPAGQQSLVVDVGTAAECLALDLRDFDVILQDFNIPDMSGMTLLKNVVARADAPVIVVTGQNDSATASDAIRNGAMDYVVKLGDYLFTIPVIIDKCIDQHRIRKENERLQGQLHETLEELRLSNRQLQESLEAQRRMAGTDHLTGLANRRRFADTLEQCFKEARRYEYDLACCMCDLDRYKQINDSLGHQVGDEILVIAAEVIRGNLRSSDVAARYGGDEFVLLLPHTCVERALAVAERIRSEFAQRTLAHPRIHQEVTLSMGVASLDADHPSSADALVSLADKALYAAKKAGRGCAVAMGFFPAGNGQNI